MSDETKNGKHMKKQGGHVTRLDFDFGRSLSTVRKLKRVPSSVAATMVAN